MCIYSSLKLSLDKVKSKSKGKRLLKRRLIPYRISQICLAFIDETFFLKRALLSVYFNCSILLIYSATSFIDMKCQTSELMVSSLLITRFVPNPALV